MVTVNIDENFIRAIVNDQFEKLLVKLADTLPYPYEKSKVLKIISDQHYEDAKRSVNINYSGFDPIKDVDRDKQFNFARYTSVADREELKNVNEHILGGKIVDHTPAEIAAMRQEIEDFLRETNEFLVDTEKFLKS